MAKAEIEDDIAVRKEEILELFSPPPGKTQFHEWIRRGKIKKARDLGGYFLLNATRKHLGMPLVDVKSLREKREGVDKTLKNRQLLYLAAKAADPFYGEKLPKYFEEPETLTEKEVEMIEDLKEQILNSAEFVSDHPMELSAYRLGLLSALEHSAYLDSLEEDE